MGRVCATRSHLTCSSRPHTTLASPDTDPQLGNLTEMGITPAEYEAFWRVADLVTDHMGEVSAPPPLYIHHHCTPLAG